MASGERWGSWVKLHRDHWMSEAMKDPSLPAWWRIVLAGVARVDSSGHAPFDRGELAHAIAPGGGRTPTQLGRSIAQAVQRGYLAPESNARCLVVSGSRFAFDRYQPTSAPCLRHR